MFTSLFKFNPWYAGAAGISIILAAVYTLNMVKNVFYGNLNQITSSFREIRFYEKFVLSVIVVMIFLVGIYPAPMFDLVKVSTDVIMSRITGK
jgi:NADH-quinone oxidoreductase subunit M